MGQGYPVGPPIRDAGQLRLLADFESRLPPPFAAHREWPIPNDRERRAIDILIAGLPRRTGVEAETNLHDLQALERDMNLKRIRRESGRGWSSWSATHGETTQSFDPRMCFGGHFL